MTRILNTHTHMPPVEQRERAPTQLPDLSSASAATPAAANQQTPSRYYVVFMTTSFESLSDVRRYASEQLAAHVTRSKKLHADGILLMAGAFLDPPDQPVQTMGVLASRAAADDYAEQDPFVVGGMVSEWVVREWTNIFQRADD